MDFKEPSYTFVENGKRKNVEEFVKRFSFFDGLFVLFCVLLSKLNKYATRPISEKLKKSVER